MNAEAPTRSIAPVSRGEIAPDERDPSGQSKIERETAQAQSIFKDVASFKPYFGDSTLVSRTKLYGRRASTSSLPRVPKISEENELVELTEEERLFLDVASFKPIFGDASEPTPVSQAKDEPDPSGQSEIERETVQAQSVFKDVASFKPNFGESAVVSRTKVYGRRASMSSLPRVPKISEENELTEAERLFLDVASFKPSFGDASEPTPVSQAKDEPDPSGQSEIERETAQAQSIFKDVASFKPNFGDSSAVPRSKLYGRRASMSSLPRVPKISEENELVELTEAERLFLDVASFKPSFGDASGPTPVSQAKNESDEPDPSGQSEIERETAQAQSIFKDVASFKPNFGDSSVISRTTRPNRRASTSSLPRVPKTSEENEPVGLTEVERKLALSLAEKEHSRLMNKTAPMLKKGAPRNVERGSSQNPYDSTPTQTLFDIARLSATANAYSGLAGVQDKSTLETSSSRRETTFTSCASILAKVDDLSTGSDDDARDTESCSKTKGSFRSQRLDLSTHKTHQRRSSAPAKSLSDDACQVTSDDEEEGGAHENIFMGALSQVAGEKSLSPQNEEKPLSFLHTMGSLRPTGFHFPQEAATSRRSTAPAVATDVAKQTLNACDGAATEDDAIRAAAESFGQTTFKHPQGLTCTRSKSVGASPHPSSFKWVKRGSSWAKIIIQGTEDERSSVRGKAVIRSKLSVPTVESDNDGSAVVPSSRAPLNSRSSSRLSKSESHETSSTCSMTLTEVGGNGKPGSSVAQDWLQVPMVVEDNGDDHLWESASTLGFGGEDNHHTRLRLATGGPATCATSWEMSS